MSRTSARVAIAFFLGAVLLVLSACSTTRVLSESGEIMAGMSKQELRDALLWKVSVSRDPFITARCGRRYFPEQEIEIIYATEDRSRRTDRKRTYFVFTGVSVPSGCKTLDDTDRGDGELSQWFYSTEEFNQFVAPLEANQKQKRIAEEQRKKAEQISLQKKKNAQEKKKRAQKAAAAKKKKAQRAAVCATGRQPDDEETFMRKLGDYALSYDREKNEIRKSRIFNEARAFDKQFFNASGRSIENWIARVGSIDTIKGGERASLVLNVVFPRQGGGIIAEQVLFAQQIVTEFNAYGSYYRGGNRSRHTNLQRTR